MKAEIKKYFLKMFILLYGFLPVTNLLAQHPTVVNTIMRDHAEMNRSLNRLPGIKYSDLKNPKIKAHTFHIVFENDSTIIAKTKIEALYASDFLTITKKGEMYIVKPAQTKQIWREDSGGEKYIGIPTDTCWLFKIRTGKINLYSRYAEYNIALAIAIQKGEGAIQAITKPVLMTLLADDKKSLALLKRDKIPEALEHYNRKKSNIK